MDKRAFLLELFTHAVRSVEPSRLVADFFRTENLGLDAYNEIHLFGSGKAAIPMGRAAADMLKGQLISGLLIAPESAEIPPLDILTGDHPIPTERSLLAAAAMKKKLAALKENAFFIYLLSGGSSALMELPAEGLTLDDIHAANRDMLGHALPIEAVNCIRKHLSAVKGGHLAAATKAKGAVLVLSDVVGDDLETIASAPLYCDRTTFAQALELVGDYGLTLTPAALAHLEQGAAGIIPETPNTPNLNIRHYLIGSNKIALKAIRDRLADEPMDTVIVTDRLTGEASEAAREMILRAKTLQPALSKPRLLIYGGETTVQIKGNGKGGRNQELALAALIELKGHEGITLLSGATDGRDGTSNAAGGIVNAALYRKAVSQGLALDAFLADNDSYHILKKLDALIDTGYTGTNVMDIVLILIEPKPTTKK